MRGLALNSTTGMPAADAPKYVSSTPQAARTAKQASQDLLGVRCPACKLHQRNPLRAGRLAALLPRLAPVDSIVLAVHCLSPAEGAPKDQTGNGGSQARTITNIAREVHALKAHTFDKTCQDNGLPKLHGLMHNSS